MAGRDIKDPAPDAGNFERQDGGNTPVTGEKHGQSKAEKVPAGARYGSPVGPDQPTRAGEGGNTPVSSGGEKHGQSKAEHVPASARY